MTGSDVDASESQAAVELFASLLRAEFEDEAVRVAEIQLEAAYGQSAEIWGRIVTRLRQ